MKKIAFALLGIALIGCEKIDTDCNCGMVTNDNVQDYSVEIRNSCSGNVKKFYLTQGDWMNAHPGSNYCITNVKNW